MKGDLIKRDQWNSMLKMGFHEVLRTLQDGNYREEITGLDLKRVQLSALEGAFNRNLMRTFEKLLRISDEKLRKVLEIYLQRYTVENVKAIIRGKLTGVSNEEVEQLLVPTATTSQAYFVDLMKKERIEDVIKKLPFAVVTKEGADLFSLENALDRAYILQLFDLAQRLRGQGKALRELIQAELDIINSKIVLRLKNECMKKVEIVQYLVAPTKEIAALAGKENVKSVIDGLRKIGLVVCDERLAESEMMTHAEIELDTTLLRKERLLMHQFPLTVNSIIGFMFAKEIEVKNLKVLVKGKKLGLDEEYLSKLVVVA
jgi:V/A-type H+-transporting ATPase subunit C